MATVYILYSKSADKYYTGFTQDFDQRLNYHQAKEFPGSYTSNHDDWELFFKIDDLEIGQARKIELHIKKMKSRAYIQNLSKYPEMAEKLKEKHK